MSEDKNPSTEVPISIQGVSKYFGEDTDNPFCALKEINAEIAAGEFVSVVGASGCGKSTLMLMVAGLLSKTTGTITVGGKRVTKPITNVGIAFRTICCLTSAPRSKTSCCMPTSVVCRASS